MSFIIRVSLFWALWNVFTPRWNRVFTQTAAFGACGVSTGPDAPIQFLREDPRTMALLIKSATMGSIVAFRVPEFICLKHQV